MTAPQPPAEARAAFGARLPALRAYVELVGSAGIERGLIGPREGPRLWDRHVLNCAAVSAVLPQGVCVADLGSGAGLPGMVLALMRPDLEVTLVEPLERRATFLLEAVAGLDAANVSVRRARAEELSGESTYDVVTARALAPLSRLLGWAMPLLTPTGELVAMKGSAAETEVTAAAKELKRWRCATPLIESVVVPGGSSTATVVRVARRSSR